jgi:hypothetical protein
MEWDLKNVNFYFRGKGLSGHSNNA